MRMKTVRMKGTLSARALAVAESEGMTVEEVVDYAVRRFVDEYEFDEEPEQADEAEEEDDEEEESDSDESDGAEDEKDEDKDDGDEESSADEEE